MELQLLPIVTFFSLFIASHGALSPEAYWNSVLPNTAMPKAVKDLLNPEKSTSGSVGKSGVHVNTGKVGTNMNVGRGSIGIINGKGTNINEGHGSVRVHTGKGTIAVIMRYYNSAASKTELQDSKIRGIYFLEKDLVPGKSRSIEFTKSDGNVTFLARWDAEKIPFLSDKMSEVFGLYDVTAGSEESQRMTKTVNECERPAAKGEEKYCATSLESMVDFSTSQLGKNVTATSTEVDKETKLQKYTVTGVRKKNSNEAVVCHKQPYPYAVFYCHHTHIKRVYTVSLAGADGTKANAVAVCHTDTSAWNPRHLSFQVLKVQPGTVPICHYLPEDCIVWVAN